MTIDSILSDLAQKIQTNKPISPRYYLDRACELNILLLNLEDELVQVEMAINRRLAELVVDEKLSVARARARVKSLPEYERLRRLQARKEQVIELVRLAKKRVELAHWDQ